MNDSRFWMTRALQLAERGRFFVSPNPVVGACIVKNGRLIAEGFHRAFGAPHAEIEVLRKAGRRAIGADLYVTLEPCSSWGKTPPCTEAIMASGIRRVIVAAVDLNPKHQGRGVSQLRKAGIRVETGVCQDEAEKQNEAFFKYIRTGKPFVTLKMAQSLDGKIASKSGESKWISSESARQWVQALRAEQDAIFVGTQTACVDNPSLLPRLRKKVLRQDGKPWRIVLDSKAKLSKKMKVFDGGNVTLRVVSNAALKRLKHKLPEGRFGWIAVPEKNGALDLLALMEELGNLGVSKLLVEGGAELAWSLIENDCVDRLCWIVAPKIIGGRNAKTSVAGAGIHKLKDAFSLQFKQVLSLGPDLLIEGRIKRK